MKFSVQGREAYAYTGGKAFDAALPCVVFIHGALNDHSVWTLPARWFAHHGHGVLALDLPGHRRSAGPALATVEALAEWVLAAMDAAGVQQAALVGHSMGSLIALAAAAQAPERATHLALLGTAVPMPVPQALLDLSAADPAAAIDRVVAFSFSSIAPKPADPGPGVWLRGAGRALMHQVLQAQGDATLFHTDFTACNAYTGGLAAADRVSCPTDLLLGEHDLMTPPRGARELAARLQARVPTRTHTLPTGHQLMAEGPDPVLHRLRLALARPG